MKKTPTKQEFLKLAVTHGFCFLRGVDPYCSPEMAAFGQTHQPNLDACLVRYTSRNVFYFVYTKEQQPKRHQGLTHTGGWFAPSDPEAFKVFCQEMNVEVIESV